MIAKYRSFNEKTSYELIPDSRNWVFRIKKLVAGVPPDWFKKNFSVIYKSHGLA